MKRSRYADEQIAYALRQAESGTAVADVCRQLGIREATFYVWKKRFGHMGVSEVRELRQLREENATLTPVSWAGFRERWTTAAVNVHHAGIRGMYADIG